MPQNKQLNLLLVENHYPDAEIFLSNLEQRSSAKEATYQVTHVNRVQEAVKILKQKSFDIVVSDLRLPDSDQNETIHRLVENKANAPFVVMSSELSHEDAKEVIQLGIDDFIDKRDFPSEKGLKRILALTIERYHLKRRLQEMLENQKKIAYTDHLTEVPNRMALIEKLTYTISLTKREKTKFAFMFVDLNHFKMINDNLGHHEGDVILKKVAKVMQKSIRESDLIARWGGDEFVIILNNIKCQTDAYQVANKISNAIKHALSKYKKYDLCASFGISMFPKDADIIDDLIRQADVAMYSAKNSNTHVAFYSNNIQFKDKIRSRISIALNSENKTKESDKVLVYKQPVFKFENGDKTVAFYEVLSKMQVDNRVMEPESYLPYIEATELMERYDFYMLHEACKLMQQESNSIYALNVSDHTFRERYFIQEVEKILKQYEVSGKNLIIELSENTVLENHEKSKAIIKELNEIGIKVALDDFGSGYSSLSYLLNTKVDYIKIDYEATREEEQCQKLQALLSAMYHFGKELDILMIAEGIESKKQLDEILKIGYRMAQGHYFGRPISISQDLIK